ncbi:cupin domain-containing protein [Peteryoungia desertarenae]|uniref:Cupin domain-containing protein n=1 Tax=Peteryoungia desertarenae TaxID=1813451 RepID=A0ABX6QJE0_9HYPH|nr:cupin domain-containing protein [Peteryoungia desertarenae]QLF68592.1 cupin domain-containing protein [Peteryoungia desertarenae]
MNAAEIIKTLGMQRHPEGGWYVETYRDEEGGSRGHSTAIYYLLEAGERSHWHKVKDASEVWHYYAGAPLALHASADGKIVTRHVLGPDLAKGERPQVVIRADEWQSAESLGDFTLVGCTVAPGFSFDAFEMAPPDWQPGG